LSSTLCCHSASGGPAVGPSSMTPALLTSVSQPAQLGGRALHRGRGLFLVGDVALQHQRGAALAPDVRGQFLQPVPPPRGQRPTAAPRSASTAAVAAPMPLDAPVTSATVPSGAGFTGLRPPAPRQPQLGRPEPRWHLPRPRRRRRQVRG